jgi:hypothetical protein
MYTIHKHIIGTVNEKEKNYQYREKKKGRMCVSVMDALFPAKENRGINLKS